MNVDKALHADYCAIVHPYEKPPCVSEWTPSYKANLPTSLTALRPNWWTDILGCIKFDNWLQWDYCVCRIIHMWKGLQLWAPNHFKFFMPHPLLTQFTFLEVWDKSKGHLQHFCRFFFFTGLTLQNLFFCFALVLGLIKYEVFFYLPSLTKIAISFQKA